MNQVVGAPVESDIVLRCSIQASPKPMTFWMKQSGSMIVPSLKYNISDQILSDYQFVSTLHIKSLKKDDFAQYICVAKNTIGKSEETIKIHEIERKQQTTEAFDFISSTTKTYRYEEYHTQKPTYRTHHSDSNSENRNISEGTNKQHTKDTSNFKVSNFYEIVKVVFQITCLICSMDTKLEVASVEQVPHIHYSHIFWS